MDPNGSFTDLMRRLRDGQDSAATQLFHRLVRRLIGLARTQLNARLRGKVDPEDVAQSVLKSFFLACANQQLDVDDWEGLWSLLAVITIRKCICRRRHFQRARRDVQRELAIPANDDSQGGLELLDREPSPEEAIYLSELVEKLMRDQDEQTRQILALRLQGKLVQEIANEVGCAERTVRRMLDRVKSRLKRLLAQAEAESLE